MVDAEEGFPILQDATGSAVVADKAQVGDPSASKIGLTVFAYRDPSGNLIIPRTDSLGDVFVSDIPNQSGVETTLTLSTTAQEAKAGGSTLTNRKFVDMQATSTKVKWGYTTACPFDLANNQFVSIPAGTLCKIYVKASSGSATVIVAEK